MAASPIRTTRKPGKNRTSARVRGGTAVQAVSSTVQTAAAAAPATDEIGAIFRLLSLVGLAGLLVVHPDTIGGVLTNGVKTVRTIISGK